MKPNTGWGYRPYTELFDSRRALSPYICRLAPHSGGFTVDFIDDTQPDSEHIVYWRPRGTGEFTPVRPDMSGGFYTVDIDCPDLADYEVYVERNDGARSSVRLVRTGDVPGKVINYLHPDDREYAFSGNYLCSPSIVKLESGRLLASMDVFAGGAPQNLTLIYYSDDDGESWHYLVELFPCFWGKLFLVNGRLYMLGVSREYGDLLIGASDDDGVSWTAPTVLFRGANCSNMSGLHRAPMPVLISHGRIMTDVQYGAWHTKVFGDAVLSAPVDSDLLCAESWTLTDFWLPENHKDVAIDGIIGAIEGNVVEAPDGRIFDILRYADGRSLMLEFDPDAPEREPRFEAIIDFPSTTSKCDIIYDPKSKLYFSLVSYNLSEPRTLRNLLSLICSEDLREWKLVKHILDYLNDDPQKIAFQYVDFLIDGDDILFQSRTAYNGAKNFHDTNFETFHRISDFRGLL